MGKNNSSYRRDIWGRISSDEIVSLFIPDTYKITFINLYYFRCPVKLSKKKRWMRNIPNKTIAALQLKTKNMMHTCDFH